MRKMPLITTAIIFCFIFIGTPPLYAGWTIDGAPICIAMGEQSQPRICSDDVGGAIITWVDGRTFPHDIYAQRISELGRARWTVNGIPVGGSDFNMIRPHITADGFGGAVIVWAVYNLVEYDLHAQRVDSLGNSIWADNGIAVCTAAYDQEWSEICADGSGGCIIAWTDERTSPNSDIYAQRIDAAGNPIWTADGIPICTADSIQHEVQIISDDSGGAIIVWVDYRAEGDLYAQKVNGAGVVQWKTDGVPVCQDNNIQYEPRIATDGAGGVFVTWYDRRGTSFDTYLQRIDSSGNEVFTPGGIVLCNESGTQRYPQITADGIGGVIVVWEDFRAGSEQSYLYAHRVNSSGMKVWPPPWGVPIRHMSGHPYDSRIVSDGNEGAIISWADDRNDVTSGWDVYAQRINNMGTCLWRENGDSLCTAPNSQSNLTATTDGAGGMIVAWRDTRNPDPDIFGQRIMFDGGFTATLLRSYVASFDNDAIRIGWKLSAVGTGMNFFVSRKNLPAGQYEELSNPAIERNDLTYTFVDDSYESGGSYTYRIDVSDEDGRRTLFETDPISTPALLPTLYQNHPNPFNPSTTIRYYVPENSHVILELYDISGKYITRLVNEEQPRGLHSVDWNGLDTQGNPVASGVYVYRLKSSKKTISRKMVLLR
ncbi:MAG: T9SS type A sorting domain-containing protein [bacterium]|nr:MAG: T9SS type A sorting domain-containing protein [bacterium]